MTKALTKKLADELELFARHVAMLREVKENGPIGIIRLSESLSLPQHKVRYSLRLLEEAKLIAPSTHGAVATDELPKAMDELWSFMEEVEKKLEDLKSELEAL